MPSNGEREKHLAVWVGPVGFRGRRRPRHKRIGTEFSNKGWRKEVEYAPIPAGPTAKHQAEKEKFKMRLMAKCSVFSVLVLTAALLATPVVSAASGRQGDDMGKASKEMSKKEKQDRWEGFITRSSKSKNMLTVRQVSSGVERDVVYDESTQWTSQEHGSKKVNAIDAAQVKDHDRVICLGKYDKKGVLHATLISKRLTHGED